MNRSTGSVRTDKRTRGPTELTTSKPFRARTRALQNTVNVKARTNIINSIEQGNIQDSK